MVGSYAGFCAPEFFTGNMIILCEWNIQAGGGVGIPATGRNAAPGRVGTAHRFRPGRPARGEGFPDTVGTAHRYWPSSVGSAHPTTGLVKSWS